MHRRTVVPQSFLGEAFRIACNLGAFSPGVTVGVKRNSNNANGVAPPPEELGAVLFMKLRKPWKQRTGFRKTFQDLCKVAPKTNDDRDTSFSSRKCYCLFDPVNVFTMEGRNVGLRASEMPAKLVERSPFGISFSSDYFL